LASSTLAEDFPSPCWATFFRLAEGIARREEPDPVAGRRLPRAVESAHPRETGKYTVILEPAAVLDIVGVHVLGLQRVAILGRRSFLNDRIGTKLLARTSASAMTWRILCDRVRRSMARDCGASACNWSRTAWFGACAPHRAEMKSEYAAKVGTINPRARISFAERWARSDEHCFRGAVSRGRRRNDRATNAACRDAAVVHP
jgi:hypothetical protein